MRIAITSTGPDTDSQVDLRFGRAAYFVVVDTDTGLSTSHSNTQNLNAAQGAGLQAAKKVADLGVEAIITGNIGPKAFSALAAANIKSYLGATGTVSETLKLFNAGSLQETTTPNVAGHWT